MAGILISRQNAANLGFAACFNHETIITRERFKITQTGPNSKLLTPLNMAKLKGNIEAANALELDDFRAKYLPVTFSSKYCIAQLKTPGAQYEITVETPSSMGPIDIRHCYDLVAETSSSAYASSGKGWWPHRKRKEMRLPELRYLLVKPAPSSGLVDPLGKRVLAPSLEGFLSFMLTYEDGYEVVYCYEIHLKEHLRNLGIGKTLMEIMERVGRKAGVDKAMLTVFLENERALKFYRELGYGEDEYSPKARKLRSGVSKLPKYVILSKPLK